jgi:uncharacterized membrane protein YqhA
LSWLVSNSRFLMLSGVLCLLTGAAVACTWGAIHVGEVVLALVRHERYLTGVVGLLHLLDAFLVAPTLLIVGVGIYELFIGPLKVPPALVVGTLHALKVKFASMLILLMSVIFVEHVISWDHPVATLAIGGGIVAVSLTLIIYTRWAET